MAKIVYCQPQRNVDLVIYQRMGNVKKSPRNTQEKFAKITAETLDQQLKNGLDLLAHA